MTSGIITALYYGFKHISSSSLEEDYFIFISKVDVSPPLICLSIEETLSSYLSFLEQEGSSFDVESFEDRSTTEYVLSKDCTGVVW